MDTVTSGCFAKTTGPSTSLRFGRDDKGRVVTSRKNRDLDGRVTNGYFAKTADPSTSLRFGRDDIGEGRSLFGRFAPWMERLTNGYLARSAYPTLRKEREGWGTHRLVAGQKGCGPLHQLFDKGSRYVRGNAVTLFG